MRSFSGESFRDRDGFLDPGVLRLIVITDGRGDLPRIERIVRGAVDGGVRCVQLREPSWTARELLKAAERLRPLLDAVCGVLLVNDRIDVAVTGVAHGVQIGYRSIPIELARAVLGDRGVLSFSAHDQADLDLAATARCDCALLSPVWPTSKHGARHLGEAKAMAYTASARLPVVWLGGINSAEAQRVADCPAKSRPAGIAVLSAVCGAVDPRSAAAALLGALGGNTTTA